MNLTPRATAFVGQQHWRTDACYSPQALAEAFDNAGLVPSAALLAFQRHYAGLVVYAGLEPICFGLVQARVHQRWLRPPVTAYELDFWKPDGDTPAHHFRCANTGYQEQFTLDENGAYYEGFQQQASSFEGVVEDLAVFAEVWAAGYRRQWGHVLEEADHQLPTAELRAALQVEAYPGFPEDLIFWGSNDRLLVRQSPAELTLFAREAFNPSTRSQYQQRLGLVPK